MIWLGIDDTDTLDTPGTNKLALHLARAFPPELVVRLIVRHQLFLDPRVPYTSHNGCASMLIENESQFGACALVDLVRPIIQQWCPTGSDPGVCIAKQVPDDVRRFALRCQRKVVSQEEALQLAARSGLHLESLGGTGDGVIGALAAVGLLATMNDGRILHWGASRHNWSDTTGCQAVADLLKWGVTEVRRADIDQRIDEGAVTLSKRLRPNLRDGKAILFVRPTTEDDATTTEWQAVKIT